MSIIQDVRTPGNIHGRCATSFRDGQFTRYVEYRQGSLAVCDSDLDSNGEPVVRTWNNDLVGITDFQPMQLSAVRSGVDGKLLVTLGGFTIGGNDSRRITVKVNLTLLPEWQEYPA